MRVFTAVRHSADPAFYYGGLWSGNFHPALQQLGCDVIESKTDLLPGSRFMHVADSFTPAELETRARITEEILNEVRARHRERPVDLFLSYFYNAHFDPAGFDELRRIGIPSVNFYCNSIYQFELVRDVAAKADFAWHAERDARSFYLAVGANPVWVQMGADPTIYHPIAGIARQPSACFVGQRYADRDRRVAVLIRSNVPLDVYGAGWAMAAEEVTKHPPQREKPKPGSLRSYGRVVGQAIARDGLIRGVGRALRQARYRRETRALSSVVSSVSRGRAENITQTFAAHEVCLNFSNVWADGRPGSALIPHVRLRDFEAPMCRTCYLTGESGEIHEFYEVGREIDTYSSNDELTDKTQFYLRSPQAAEQLREAGYRRALRDHTWVSRFQELFKKIGLDAEDMISRAQTAR